jgi:hypothetical protein
MLCKYYRNCENYDDNGYNCNYIQPDLDCYKPKHKLTLKLRSEIMKNNKPICANCGLIQDVKSKIRCRCQDFKGWNDVE